jgi:hypothetical protein
MTVSICHAEIPGGATALLSRHFPSVRPLRPTPDSAARHAAMLAVPRIPCGTGPAVHVRDTRRRRTPHENVSRTSRTPSIRCQPWVHSAPATGSTPPQRHRSSGFPASFAPAFYPSRCWSRDLSRARSWCSIINVRKRRSASFVGGFSNDARRLSGHRVVASGALRGHVFAPFAEPAGHRRHLRILRGLDAFGERPRVRRPGHQCLVRQGDRLTMPGRSCHRRTARPRH